MSGHEPPFENAVRVVLDAIKGFPVAVALRALQRSIELTNAVQESVTTGRDVGTLIDLDSLKKVEGLEETLAALLDVEPDVPTAAGRECESAALAEQ